MTILDGKKLKQEILDQLKEEVSKLSTKPKLVVIQVGDDHASTIYVNQKEQIANYVGYKYEYIQLKENISEEEMLTIINKLNNDPEVTGILVQMPLPIHLDSKKIQNKINYLKDVDGLNSINAGKLLRNEDTLIPCTAIGIIDLLNKYNIKIEGEHVVIIGRNDFIGKPLTNLFINNDATVTLCHSKTKNLKNITQTADILVVAVGQPNFITEDMVKDNATIIDVGINRIGNKLSGDVDFTNVSKKVKYITPVPGGVGPMTVAELGQNLLKAYQNQSNT